MPTDAETKIRKIARVATANIVVALIVITLKYIAYAVSGSVALFSDALESIVNVMTAAAPPPAATLEAMQRQGFRVTHVYGLTETYGPSVVCAWTCRSRYRPT